MITPANTRTNAGQLVRTLVRGGPNQTHRRRTGPLLHRRTRPQRQDLGAHQQLPQPAAEGHPEAPPPATPLSPAPPPPPKARVADEQTTRHTADTTLGTTRCLMGTGATQPGWRCRCRPRSGLLRASRSRHSCPRAGANLRLTHRLNTTSTCDRLGGVTMGTCRPNSDRSSPTVAPIRRGD